MVVGNVPAATRRLALSHVNDWRTMDSLLNGLPIHVLVIHVVVILVPLAALCLVLGAAWPAARARLGIATPLVALVAAISTFIAVEAGEVLQTQVASTALSRAHTAIGEDLRPWVVALFALAVIQWVWYRGFTGTGRYSTTLTSRNARLAITLVLAIAIGVVAVGAVVETVLIGESGARAAWESRLG
jgi:uncharacterized membrane protein